MSQDLSTLLKQMFPGLPTNDNQVLAMAKIPESLMEVIKQGHAEGVKTGHYTMSLEEFTGTLVATGLYYTLEILNKKR